mmetsp:Transcript_34871/g.78241  ORF Transcript_34871/g.78241 Transcript_34871/m.78241 type:complete len:107 (-) Transcript_34871:183-503(-)
MILGTYLSYACSRVARPRAAATCGVNSVELAAAITSPETNSVLVVCDSPNLVVDVGLALEVSGEKAKAPATAPKIIDRRRNMLKMLAPHYKVSVRSQPCQPTVSKC